MDLDQLENYFSDYVEQCRINIPNLPQSFLYENDNFRTVIRGEGDVPDSWLNNAVFNLNNKFEDTVATVSRTANDSSIFVIEFRPRPTNYNHPTTYF
jgi:hypothetical protein